jgi:hypothetical protein
LRSTILHLSAFLALVALAAGLASGTGCASTDPSPLEEHRSAPPESDAPGAGETTFGNADASAVPTSPVRGSPLCGVTAGKCMPDDDGTRATWGAHCAEPLPEAGVAPNPDASTIADGCRITKVQDGSYAPECSSDADRGGVDGVACEKGSDCAPGYDCIDGEKGAVCRRYCCSGSCATQLSQNGGPTFCDIQKLLEANPHKAPVCMPLKACKLLTAGECGDKETCAVVTEKGDTGCVAKGSAKAGEPCDEEHCNADLTCLGSPGDRRCHKLCRFEGSDCGRTQTCATGTVFGDTTFGVCKEMR